MTEKELIETIKKIVKPYVQREEGLKEFSKETKFIKDLEINSANWVECDLWMWKMNSISK